jgi:carbamate kinase
VRSGEAVTIATQFAHARAAMRAVVPLLAAGHRAVITHGNGFRRSGGYW